MTAMRTQERREGELVDADWEDENFFKHDAGCRLLVTISLIILPSK